jgi:hypothetical protein
MPLLGIWNVFRLARNRAKQIRETQRLRPIEEGPTVVLFDLLLSWATADAQHGEAHARRDLILIGGGLILGFVGDIILAVA